MTVEECEQIVNFFSGDDSGTMDYKLLLKEIQKGIYETDNLFYVLISCCRSSQVVT